MTYPKWFLTLLEETGASEAFTDKPEWLQRKLFRTVRKRRKERATA